MTGARSMSDFVVAWNLASVSLRRCWLNCTQFIWGVSPSYRGRRGVSENCLDPRKQIKMQVINNLSHQLASLSQREGRGSAPPDFKLELGRDEKTSQQGMGSSQV